MHRKYCICLCTAFTSVRILFFAAPVTGEKAGEWPYWIILCFLPFLSRVQRCAMLQFSEFHEKLLTTLCKKTEDGLTTEHAQSLVLDTLCWLAGVYSNGPGR